MANYKHQWGNDVERLVHWTPGTGKRKIYMAEELHPDKSVVYVEEGDHCYAAKVCAIEIGNDSSTEKGHLQLYIPGSRPVSIECHVEVIPYGSDTPPRYELVIDSDIDRFELLDDYSKLKHQFRKESALKEFMRADNSR